ncbi:PEP/pyruvate-binding domain-containing protein [Cryptosporangium minutisporangium]|uniref:Phosphoenolpyruvate synthase n=1 Tax=Cryptosporangium minutisporangium TaxID=113569 RepID=A0ABP6T746_9ACTN
MLDTSATVLWFDDLSAADTAIAGGKGANLGELTRAGLPVPPGFVLSATAYLQAMDAAGLREELAARVVATRTEDPSALAALADELGQKIAAAPLPAGMNQAILAAYHRLGDDVSVAVRSSMTAEDPAGISFAGMNETYTNVRGDEQLLSKLRECWASLYRPRVIAYRAAQGLTEEPAIAVVVQRMVRSERSGVMFSADPASNDTAHVVIEGALGLGEVVVSGQVIPDTYVVRKTGPTLLQATIGYQSHEIVTGPDGADQRVELTPAEAARRVLSDAEAVDLARLAIRVEQHYGSAQDMEWAIENGCTYLVQTRPLTTLHEPVAATAAPSDGPHGRRLLSGLASAPGRISGVVRILRSPVDADRFAAGEILVAAMTSPDWMAILRKAAALVTDGGGLTCHAAVVSRELRIPGIVGTRTATTTLRDGQLVTVDGRLGAVFDGPVDAVAEPGA